MLVGTDYNNFAPSVSVAWSPDIKAGVLGRLFGSAGQSVIRAGYSVAFVREGLGNVTQAVGGNPGGTLTLNSDVDDGSLPIGTLYRNRAALTPPSFPGTPTYPFFGRITAAYQDISTTNDPGGRPIQFVLRFNF